MRRDIIHRMDQRILIDKPAGMTSFGVVARVRRVLSQRAGKKVKVGHTGTLDPFATGLLVLLTGRETKNAMALTKLDKTYQATMILGQTSTTGDPEGEISQVSIKKPELDQIQAALDQFVGWVEQTPPQFSAIKVNGQRAYKLARAGKAVEIPTRRVFVRSISLDLYDYPEVRITTDVSSGTYIRTLVEDVGKALGTGAYTSQLRRTRVGEFLIDDAVSLADFGVND